MQGLLRETVGWLYVLLSLGGVAVCALHLGRSRWVGLLMGGFALETLIEAFYRLATLAMGHGLMAATSVGAIFLLASMLGLLGRAAIVGGLGGVLSERWAASAPAPRPGA